MSFLRAAIVGESSDFIFGGETEREMNGGFLS